MKNTDIKPIYFERANKSLSKPSSMTDEECSSLYVYTNGHECISCWKLTFRQRLYLLFHGKIWLSVLSGITQPPVWLDCDNDVFDKYGIE